MIISRILSTMFVVLAFAKAIPLQAQSQLKARATYIAQTKMDIKLDSAQKAKMNSNPMYKQIMESMSKPHNQEFQLEFTATKSSYEEVKQLAKPEKPTNGISITVMASGDASSTIYKDLENQQYVKKDQIMGKDFIITDQLNAYEWELHNETKKIGQFTCYKATYTPPVDEEMVKELKEKMEEEKSNNPGILDMAFSEEDTTITAWYTPEVQVNHGPGEFHGLPGLIVEVKEYNTVILLQSLEMNPKKTIELKKPKGGKKINQADFDALLKKKTDEMMKKQGSSNGAFQVFTIGG